MAGAPCGRSSREHDGNVPGAGRGVIALLATLVNHEAHHRGQLGILARQLGHPITQAQMLDLWDYHRREKDGERVLAGR